MRIGLVSGHADALVFNDIPLDSSTCPPSSPHVRVICIYVMLLHMWNVLELVDIPIADLLSVLGLNLETQGLCVLQRQCQDSSVRCLLHARDDGAIRLPRPLRGRNPDHARPAQAGHAACGIVGTRPDHHPTILRHLRHPGRPEQHIEWRVDTLAGKELDRTMQLLHCIEFANHKMRASIWRHTRRSTVDRRWVSALGLLLGGAGSIRERPIKDDKSATAPCTRPDANEARRG